MFAHESESARGFFHCVIKRLCVYMLNVSSGKRNGTVRRLSVCLSVTLVGILTVTHQRAAIDAASVHFGQQQGGSTYLLKPRDVSKRDVSRLRAVTCTVHVLIFGKRCTIETSLLLYSPVSPLIQSEVIYGLSNSGKSGDLE